MQLQESLVHRYHARREHTWSQNDTGTARCTLGTRHDFTGEHAARWTKRDFHARKSGWTREGTRQGHRHPRIHALTESSFGENCDKLSPREDRRAKEDERWFGRVVTPWPSGVVLCFTPSPLSSRTRLHENVPSASAVSTRQRKPRRQPSAGVAPAVNVTRHPWLRLLTRRYSHFRARPNRPIFEIDSFQDSAKSPAILHYATLTAGIVSVLKKVGWR